MDLAYYELRYQDTTGDAQWQNSVPLVLKVARPATSVSVAAKTGAYLIKARDKLNNPSVNATVVYTSVTSIGNFNAVATSTQNPTFSGTKTDVVLVTKEDGTLWDYDTDGTIGNGSTVEVLLSVYDTRMKSIVGTRLDKVIVLDHVEYIPPQDDGGTSPALEKPVEAATEDSVLF